MSFDELVESALKLPSDMKLQLIEIIEESMDIPLDSDLDADYLAEINRRVKEIEEGKVALIPGEEVMRKIEEMFKDEK